VETPRVLDVQNLYFSYRNRPALMNVTLAVEECAIHGFVGPNGAGKTTTLKILATLLRPLSGRTQVFGHDVVREYKSVRRRIGFMPDVFNMYPQMTVYECLDFFAAAYGMKQAERDKVIADVLTLTDMSGRKDDYLKSLSRGMLQRLSLARVLVHDPALLLLDEPASGLDPRGRIELMEILKELRRMGKTIFVSSHILSELRDLCDSITIIDRGRTKYCGSMDLLLSQAGGPVRYTLTLAGELETLCECLGKVPGVTEVQKQEGRPDYVVTFDRSTVNTNEVLHAAIQCGGRVIEFKENLRHLNEAFLDLTEPGVPS
jgi:ABC-2 type transport system ATP-binding protein